MSLALFNLERVLEELVGTLQRLPEPARIGALGLLGGFVALLVTTRRYGAGQQWQRLQFGLGQVDALHKHPTAQPAHRWLEAIPSTPVTVTDNKGPRWPPENLGRLKSALSGELMTLSTGELDRLRAALAHLPNDQSTAALRMVISTLTLETDYSAPCPADDRQAILGLEKLVLGASMGLTTDDIRKAKAVFERKAVCLTNEEKELLNDALHEAFPKSSDNELRNNAAAALEGGTPLTTENVTKVVRAIGRRELLPREAAERLLRAKPAAEVHLAFDVFLYELHKIEIAIEKRCVTIGAVKPLIKYWLERLSDQQPDQGLRLALEYYMNTYFKGVLSLIRRGGFMVHVWPTDLGGMSWGAVAVHWVVAKLGAIARTTVATPLPSGVHCEPLSAGGLRFFAVCSVCGKRPGEPLARLDWSSNKAGEEALEDYEILGKLTGAADAAGWKPRKPWKNLRSGLENAICKTCGPGVVPRSWYWYGLWALFPAVGFGVLLLVGSRLHLRLFDTESKKRLLKQLLAAGLVSVAITALAGRYAWNQLPAPDPNAVPAELKTPVAAPAL